MLRGVVRVDLGDEGAFENSPKGSEGGSHAAIWGRRFQAEGTNRVKFLRQECAWHSLRSSREASVAEQTITVGES